MFIYGMLVYLCWPNPFFLDKKSHVIWYGLSSMLVVCSIVLFHPSAFLKKNGNRLLTLASSRGHTEIVALILNALREAGVDISQSLDKALKDASLNGHTKIVQLLLKASQDASFDISQTLNFANNTGHTLLMAVSSKAILKSYSSYSTLFAHCWRRYLSSTQSRRQIWHDRADGGSL